jgi:TetR/AcrR family transcriptional repressor of mexJK operon
MSEQPSSSNGPGRPKDLAKRQAILDAAQVLFLHSGYEGTSMDTIASAAGVSKLTLYSHFSDKEGLYVAAIKAACEAQLPPLMFDQTADTPISTVLQRIGLAFNSLINSPQSLALHRLLLSMSAQDTKLAQLFYDAGPQRLLDGMEQLLRRADHNRELRIEHPRTAAEHFFCLIKGDHNFRLLIGCVKDSSAEQAEQHVTQVVQMFVRAYRLD